jgi:hypothetical protein
MPSPDSDSVLKALAEAKDLAENFGLHREAAEFQEFHRRFETEKPTLKALRRDVEPVRNQFAITIRARLYDDSGELRVGMESLVEQYEHVSVALLNVIYPIEPRLPEMDISGFAGSQHVKEKMVSYAGDAAGVRLIIERSIALVRRYSKHVGSGELEAAYRLTDSGLRVWMSYGRFVGAHERAAREYGGPALEFRIDRFQFVYVDAAARAKSKAGEGWPKTTPKERRRSCVTGFWIRDRAAQTGCWGGFLISEEHDEYQIASFTFYSQ